eukprot:10967510-Karenia_brevis.AAC.1
MVAERRTLDPEVPVPVNSNIGEIDTEPHSPLPPHHRHGISGRKTECSRRPESSERGRTKQVAGHSGHAHELNDCKDG